MTRSTRRGPHGPPLVLAGVLSATLLAPWTALAAEPDEARLAQSLDRELALRLALDRTPGLKASAQRALSMKESSAAEGRLPPPELTVDVWQVPFARPASIGDSQMISVGVRQAFPAPGSLAAREEAQARGADVEAATSADRAREVVRAVDHALVDLEQATAMMQNHLAHKRLADELEQVAIARQAGGGRLSDVTQTRVEVASFEADAASEAASGLRARILLNALLGRPADAELARPGLPAPTTVAVSVTELNALAAQARPEVRAARARSEVARATARAAEQEARWPMFTVGALYFAPTSIMPQHGYGVSASATLPWLGGAATRRSAEQKLVRATALDAQDSDYRIGIDVATAYGAVKAAEARTTALGVVALPAAKQALDVALASYRSGQGDLMSLLRAERVVVDVEQEMVTTRAALEHALVELDWAVGARVPRGPITLLEVARLGQGAP